MLIASGEDSDGQLVALGLKAMCPVWQGGVRRDARTAAAPSAEGRAEDGPMDGQSLAEKYSPPQLQRVSN